MKDRRQLYKYIFSDAIMSLVTWVILNGIRMMDIMQTDEFSYSFLIPEYNAKIVYPLIPVFWFFMHWVSGYYNDVWFKSRLSEIITTLLTTLIGSIILFFAIIVDDQVSDYTAYYKSFLTLIGLQFILTYMARLAITTSTAALIKKGSIGFNTLIVGVGERAAKLYSDLCSTPKSTGYIIKGFVRNGDKTAQKIDRKMVVGTTASLVRLVKKMEITEVIVATDNITEDKLYSLIGSLSPTGVKIAFVPTKYQLITGSVKLDTIYGIPMVDLSAIKMNAWEVNVKRLLDIVLSILAIVLLSPLYLALFICVGRQPVYSQERIGKHGRPFKMYKFRSMEIGAENGTPMLSSEDDPRVTKVGRTLRKYRLDELPQFWNVIKGDMSIVGPRPERAYYIDQIVKEAPYYYMLQNVRPGVTSWGMVKFGYANSVDKMVERAAYDILYLENASVLLDIKIMIYTLKTIFTGKGM